jgi:Aminoglycoside-2''-adenylyltransferase
MSLEAPAFAGLWPWEPITPSEVADVLRGLPVPWWIAGGWAIELFLGHPTRRHYDMDVAVLRRDQLALRHHLAGWDLHSASPERRLQPWDGRFLEQPIARIWSRRERGAPWLFDGYLEEARDELWVDRDDERVSLPLGKLGRVTDDGLPFLSPEIVLFYMLSWPTPKAKADFLAARPKLSAESRDWLRRSLEIAQPGHLVLPLL